MPEEWSEGRDLATCGNTLIFRQVVGSQSPRLQRCYFCHLHTLCEVCAIRRARVAMRSIVPKLINLVLDGYTLSHVDYSQVNSQVPRDGVLDLNRTWSRWWNRAKVSKHRNDGACEVAKVLGGVWRAEFTHNARLAAAGEAPWHPHHHAIWVHRERLDWKRLRAEWGQVNGYSAQFHATVIRSCFLRDRGYDRETIVRQLHWDVLELTKYVTKFGGLGHDERLQLHESLHRTWRPEFVGKRAHETTRLADTFGMLRGLAAEPSYDQDLDQPDWSSVAFEELVFRFNNGGYRLIRSELVDQAASGK